MQNNALIVRDVLQGEAFTLNAIAAILGNMEAESTINPGIWEGLAPYSGGYGLVQWTPYTKYSNWAGSNWENAGNKQLSRIVYEFNNGIQWSTEYGHSVQMTALEFKRSTADVYTLADAFLRNYENPLVIPQPQRGVNAEKWFNYLSGHPSPAPPHPDPGPGPEPETSGLEFWMMMKIAGRI